VKWSRIQGFKGKDEGARSQKSEFRISKRECPPAIALFYLCRIFVLAI
jgi:hypothetical protein